MSLNKQGSSLTLPSPPPSSPQKSKASRHSKLYIWSLALFPKLLDKEETLKSPAAVGYSKYFLLTMPFDRSKQVGPRSSTLSRPRCSPLTSKSVWRETVKSISALSAHSAVKGLRYHLLVLSPISVISTFLRAVSLTN